MDRKPTPAQLEALKFVAEHGPDSGRPVDYHGYSHGVYVRRDVWERCHKLGWLDQESWTYPSRLTEAGRKAVEG